MAEVVGCGDHRYEPVPGPAEVPEGWIIGQAFVVTDRDGYAFVYNRSEHPMMVFDRSGGLVDHWGEGWLTSAHGLAIDDAGDLYLSAIKSHVVYKCDRSGRRLLELGNADRPSNPACGEHVLQWLREPPPGRYGPFSWPTDVSVDADGHIFVTDGYGNSQVHRYSPAADLEASWGGPGREPGEFHIPHGIAHHGDRVLVADRENSRVQVFDRDGALTDCWTDVILPCGISVDADGTVYVAEGTGGPWSSDPQGRFVSIFSAAGELLARWSGPRGAGAHAICAGPDGALYVGQNHPGERLLRYQRL